MSAETGSWKIVLPCSRVRAEALASAADLFPDMDEPPVLNTLEPDPARPEEWLLEAYVEHEPDAATLAAVHALVPDANAGPRVEYVPAQDWVTLSQAGLEPVQAGRFFVHTAAHAGRPPAGGVPLRIEAGRAFGTGQHATTAGCLEMLDHMRRRGVRGDTILDIGTGTGLLAFAAVKLWPRAVVVASDIDPVSIEVAAENAEANDVAVGVASGKVALTVADGLDDPLIAELAPFDIVVANILAAPLIAMAADIAVITVPGGSVILAGLLARQAADVSAAYRRYGFRTVNRIDKGDWPTLRMRMRR